MFFITQTKFIPSHLNSCVYNIYATGATCNTMQQQKKNINIYNDTLSDIIDPGYFE